MIIKKVFICIVCCLFVFSSCEKKGQAEKLGDSQSGVRQEAVDETGESYEAEESYDEGQQEEKLNEIMLQLFNASAWVEEIDEAEAVAAAIREKYGNFIKTASIEELVNNFDFYLPLFYGVTIYNEKGNWHCDFEYDIDIPYFISNEIYDDSLIVYISVKENSQSDFFVKYKITIPRRDVISSIYDDGHFYTDIKEYNPDSEDKFSVEIPVEKNEDKYFFTASKLNNDNKDNNYNKIVCNEDIEKLFANTVWITSNKGNQKYRDVNSGIVRLADECKYLIFDKYNDDIIVYYGYSDFPGESPVYDHFAGRVCGVDCSEGKYTFYVNPITNIDKLINDCFVSDISNAIYGNDSFAITFKKDDAEEEDNFDIKYVSFDENFESYESKFVKYENAHLLKEYNARILKDWAYVFSSEFVSDPKIATLSEGDILQLLYKSKRTGSDVEDEECWYYCQLRDGRCGWISGEFVDCPDMDKLPLKEYTLHEVNTCPEFPIEYKKFFRHMFFIYEEDRLGYVPVKERRGEFIITDNKFLSNEFDGKIYIGMDKSELIQLFGEPVREIDEFTLEYCQEHLAYNNCGNYWYYGTFYFTNDNKLESIKVVCKIL